MDSITKRFGENLKYNRKLKKLTQSKLAGLVGINLRQLARIEAGESFVTAETLQKLCDVLNIPPKTLFDFDNKNQTIQAKNNSLNKDYIDFYQNVASALQDQNKVRLINLACKAIKSKQARKNLKTMFEDIK